MPAGKHAGDSIEMYVETIILNVPDAAKIAAKAAEGAMAAAAKSAE
eukprot:SAG22_NODE_10444_length_535_cov_1.059633_1_plen_45_part_10